MFLEPIEFGEKTCFSWRILWFFSAASKLQKSTARLAWKISWLIAEMNFHAAGET